MVFATYHRMRAKGVSWAGTSHHVGMSWIICSNDEIKYEMDKNNHQYWFNKVPWYNIDICSRLHGILFEDFMTHARTDRYILMSSLVAHDKITSL